MSGVGMSRSGRWVRRVAFVAAFAMVLQVGLPVAAIPPSGGFPLGGVWRLLHMSAAWGAPEPAPDPHTPEQSRGGPVNGGHDVSASATRANGGVGRPRGKGAGELPEYIPATPQA